MNPAANPIREQQHWRRLIEAVQESDVEFLRSATRQGDGASDRFANQLADPRTGKTLLHYAAAYDARDVVRFLTAEPGADFAAKDRHGRSPADIAYQNWGHTAVARYLLNRELEQQRAGRDLPRDAASREAAARKVHEVLTRADTSAPGRQAQETDAGRQGTGRFTSRIVRKPRDRDDGRER